VLLSRTGRPASGPAGLPPPHFQTERNDDRTSPQHQPPHPASLPHRRRRRRRVRPGLRSARHASLARHVRESRAGAEHGRHCRGARRDLLPPRAERRDVRHERRHPRAPARHARRGTGAPRPARHARRTPPHAEVLPAGRRPDRRGRLRGDRTAPGARPDRRVPRCGAPAGRGRSCHPGRHGAQLGASEAQHLTLLSHLAGYGPGELTLPARRCVSSPTPRRSSRRSSAP